MIAAAQYSAVEIAFGIVLYLLALAFFLSVCGDVLFKRRDRD